jgi:hypothetical protein
MAIKNMKFYGRLFFAHQLSHSKSKRAVLVQIVYSSSGEILRIKSICGLKTYDLISINPKREKLVFNKDQKKYQINLKNSIFSKNSNN